MWPTAWRDVSLDHTDIWKAVSKPLKRGKPLACSENPLPCPRGQPCYQGQGQDRSPEQWGRVGVHLALPQSNGDGLREVPGSWGYIQCTRLRLVDAGLAEGSDDDLGGLGLAGPAVVGCGCVVSDGRRGHRGQCVPGANWRRQTKKWSGSTRTGEGERKGPPEVQRVWRALEAVTGACGYGCHHP